MKCYYMIIIRMTKKEMYQIRDEISTTRVENIFFLQTDIL